jgi:predicted small secreted protein
MRRTAARAAALLLVAASLTACGGGKVQGTLGRNVKQLDSPAPAPEILGLKAQSEDVSKLISTVSDLYVNAVSIYSLRKDDVVQATLQISRFNAKARPNDPEFRKTLVTNLGGSEGTPTTVGKDTVFITQGTRQRVAVWFRAKTVFILTTRDDYDMPRALLRESLQIGEVAK